MTGCTCKGPGYCERHRVYKTKFLFQLCQKREAFFNAWENGTGPGQNVDYSEMKRRRSMHRQRGVGTYLTTWFSSMGIKAHKGCRCKSLAAEMDRVGIGYIEEHLEDYVNKMYESAKEWRQKKGLFPQPPKFAIRALIRWAIHAAKSQAGTAEFELPNKEE